MATVGRCYSARAGKLDQDPGPRHGLARHQGQRLARAGFDQGGEADRDEQPGVLDVEGRGGGGPNHDQIALQQVAGIA